MPRLALVLISAVCAALIAAAPAAAAEEGDFDRTFGDQGRIDLAVGDAAFEAFDAVVDAQGRLVVVGASQGDVAVARLLPDGDLDESFAGDGVANIDSGTTAGGERAKAVAIDLGTGKIVVAGDASVASNSQYVVARLTPAGVLDTTFDGPAGNGNGVFRVDFDPLDEASDVVLSGDKVIVGGTVGGNQASNRARIFQLNSNGTLDTTNFGAPNGYLDLQWQAGSGSFVNSLARQSDGKIVVAGSINGTATLGVARITTGGALDTTFNSSGAVPGILRPQLPAGRISARPTDVRAVPDGIVLVGSSQAGSGGGFDTDPIVVKVTLDGAADAEFGASNGFRIVPAGAQGDISVFQRLEILADGSILAGGIVGPVGPDLDQVLARFDATGSLDTEFAGTPDGLIRSGIPGRESNVGVPAANGVVYMVGQGWDTNAQRIAGAAVCVDVPPGCPSPDAPVSLQVDPASGGDENNPRVSGELAAGAPATSVSIYADAACSGEVAATGPAAEFAGEGLAVTVADNSTTTFHAAATGPNGTSACSTASVTYTETTPPPAPPVSLQVDPASGADENNPEISGELAAGPAATTVSIYADAACSGEPAATGSASQFAGDGIAVTVPDNSTTTFHATATGGGGTSECSTASVTYAEITPPGAEEPPPNARPDAKVVGLTGQRAAALKKCAKIKPKAKKRKCKQRARKLPV